MTDDIDFRIHERISNSLDFHKISLAYPYIQKLLLHLPKIRRGDEPQGV